MPVKRPSTLDGRSILDARLRLATTEVLILQVVASGWSRAMWADNETEVDLLGFDFLVDTLFVALTESRGCSR
jgi:hypothetical protein